MFFWKGLPPTALARVFGICCQRGGGKYGIRINNPGDASKAYSFLHTKHIGRFPPLLLLLLSASDIRRWRSGPRTSRCICAMLYEHYCSPLSFLLMTFSRSVLHQVCSYALCTISFSLFVCLLLCGFWSWEDASWSGREYLCGGSRDLKWFAAVSRLSFVLFLVLRVKLTCPCFVFLSLFIVCKTLSLWVFLVSGFWLVVFVFEEREREWIKIDGEIFSYRCRDWTHYSYCQFRSDAEPPAFRSTLVSYMYPPKIIRSQSKYPWWGHLKLHCPTLIMSYGRISSWSACWISCWDFEWRVHWDLHSCLRFIQQFWEELGNLELRWPKTSVA